MHDRLQFYIWKSEKAIYKKYFSKKIFKRQNKIYI